MSALGNSRDRFGADRCLFAADSIGQGERMQYADIPQGRPSAAAHWGKGAAGSFVWGPTSDHEYIGRRR